MQNPRDGNRHEPEMSNPIAEGIGITTGLLAIWAALRRVWPSRRDLTAVMESLSRDVRELTETFRAHAASDQRWMDAREHELQDWRQEIDERLASINRCIDDLRERVLHQERR